ncbi:MAG: asparagine synthase-related protein [Pseudobdellovibrionaceae bacterium]
MCGIWMRTRIPNKIDLQKLVHTVSIFFSGKVPAMLARLAKKRFYRHIVGENLDNQVKLITGFIANQLRQEMFHSIEVRTPFLDKKVANLVGQIQTNSLLRGLTKKYIIRKVGKRHLNLEHSQRGKDHFLPP